MRKRRTIEFSGRGVSYSFTQVVDDKVADAALRCNDLLGDVLSFSHTTYLPVIVIATTSFMSAQLHMFLQFVNLPQCLKTVI